ncbi:MAG: hypothetical protein ACYC27_12850 [Armatimonadota bacterium]
MEDIMENDNLTTFMQQMRELFYSYAQNVPDELAYIEEKIEPSPDEINLGDTLYLGLIPRVDYLCQLKLYIADEYISIHTGENADFELNPLYDKDVSTWHNKVEKIIAAVISGKVVERKIYAFGKQLQITTTVGEDTGKFGSGGNIGCLYSFLLLFPFVLSQREMQYKAYIE